MTDYDDYWEHFDDLKSQRPECKGNPDGDEHCMISYESEHVKECADCGYIEEIEKPMDE